jgi:hypothetical protein
VNIQKIRELGVNQNLLPLIPLKYEKNLLFFGINRLKKSVFRHLDAKIINWKQNQITESIKMQFLSEKDENKKAINSQN